MDISRGGWRGWLTSGTVALVAGGGVCLMSGHIIKTRSLIHAINKEIHSHLEIGDKSSISIINTEEECNAASCMLQKDLKQFPFLGLDTEWVNDRGQNRPVSMLQLATFTGRSFLIRLCNLGRVPERLRLILADPDIIKVGVSILDDSHKLLTDHCLELVGCLDLRHLAVLEGSVPGKLGLQSLAQHYLGVSLDKDWRLRSGDWEAEQLSDRQIKYAANDALVAINIFWVLIHSQMSASFFNRIRSYYWSHSELLGECQSICSRYTDLQFSNKGWKQMNRSCSKDSKLSVKMNQKARGNAVRKTPLYHNCMLQAPDGQVLCTCDIKKAEWYVKKGIGEMVSQEPLVVRLKFEPSGRPEGKAGEYYLSVKPNICVVCGAQDSYLRKNVVPHEYRRYFPAVMKDHQSHDVLLLCVHCHQLSNLHDAALRAQLAKECDAPIGTENDVKLRDNFELKRVQSAGRALAKSKNKIPPERKEELYQVLRDHYEVDDITEELIACASECNFHEVNSNYTPHSRAVVQHYLKEGGLLELEVKWRKHFLDTMRPKHLPELWSLTHQEERLGVKAAENRIDKEQYILATQGAAEEIDLEEYRRHRRSQLGVNPQTETNAD